MNTHQIKAIQYKKGEHKEDDTKKNEKTVYSKKEKQNLILKLESEMKQAARDLDFERATTLRDAMFELLSED